MSNKLEMAIKLAKTLLESANYIVTGPNEAPPGSLEDAVLDTLVDKMYSIEYNIVDYLVVSSLIEQNGLELFTKAVARLDIERLVREWSDDIVYKIAFGHQYPHFATSVAFGLEVIEEAKKVHNIRFPRGPIADNGMGVDQKQK